MPGTGHGHCGQLAVPLLSPWSYPGPTEEEGIVADGSAPDGSGAEGTPGSAGRGGPASAAPRTAPPAADGRCGRPLTPLR